MRKQSTISLKWAERTQTGEGRQKRNYNHDGSPIVEIP